MTYRFQHLFALCTHKASHIFGSIVCQLPVSVEGEKERAKQWEEMKEMQMLQSVKVGGFKKILPIGRPWATRIQLGLRGRIFFKPPTLTAHNFAAS